MGLVTGCVGGATSQPAKKAVPAGFEVYQGNGYRFAYPQQWQRMAKTGSGGEALMTVRSGPVTNAAHCYGFVSRQEHYSSDVVVAVRALLDVDGDKTQKVLQNKEVSMPGAKQGIMVERTYDRQSGGVLTRLHMFEVHYLISGGTAFAFSIGAPEADVASCRVREVLDSFRLSAGAA